MTLGQGAPGCSNSECACHLFGPVCDEFQGGRFCPRCGWSEDVHRLLPGHGWPRP